MISDFLGNFSDIFSSLKVKSTRRQDLVRLLTLRDKLYFLVKDIVHDIISSMEAMKPLKRDGRYEKYLEAYDDSVEYYLRRKAMKLILTALSGNGWVTNSLTLKTMMKLGISSNLLCK